MPKYGRKDWDENGPQIPEDEPVFLIRGQDMNGGDAVRVWARLAEERGASKHIIETARQQACAMDVFNKEHTPDLPYELEPEEEPESEEEE